MTKIKNIKNIFILVLGGFILYSLALWNFHFQTDTPSLNSIIPVVKNFKIETHLILFLEIVILIVLVLLYKYTRPHWEFSRYLRNILIGDAPDLQTLAGFIILLAFLTWFYDFVREGFYFQALITFISAINFSLFFILATPFHSIKHCETSEMPPKNKIIIMALSLPSQIEKQNLEEIFSLNETADYENQLKNIKHNWALPLRVINHHKDTAEKFYFLVSKEGNKKQYFQKFKNLVQKLFGNKIASKLTPSKPVNFNEYDEISKELENIIKKIFQKCYSNKDININISGGTSAVTAALVIEAINEGRQIEYFTQEKPSRYISINISEEYVRKKLGI